MSDAYQYLATIGANFGLLDTANGGPKDGLFDKNDLEALAKNPNLSEDLREAVNFLLKNPAAFNAADTANQANGTTGDRKISADDIKAFFQNAGRTAEYEELLGRAGKILEEIDEAAGNTMSAGEAGKVFKDNFKMLDAADGQRNNGVSVKTEDLVKLLNENPGLDKDVRDAIQFFIDNPAMNKALDVAVLGGNVNSHIIEADVDAFVKNNPLKPSEQKKPVLDSFEDDGDKVQKDTPKTPKTPTGDKPVTEGPGVDKAGALGGGGSLSIGDIARLLGEICEKCETALKTKAEKVNGQAEGDLSMNDQRELQELGEILKAFATLFANLIKMVGETGDKSASKI